ncbi:MAG: hypothetical protein AAFY02_03860 [Pseudomonadota bacterium]
MVSRVEGPSILASSGLIDQLLGPAVAAVAVTFLVKFVASLWQEKQKRRGLVVALAAEIGEGIIASQGFLDGTDVDAIESAMADDPDYIPFTTADPSLSRALYNDLRRDLGVLKPDELRAVVHFYVEESLTQAMITDLRTDAFASLKPERKQAYLRILIKQAQETVDAGQGALTLLRSNHSVLRLASYERALSTSAPGEAGNI